MLSQVASRVNSPRQLAWTVCRWYSCTCPHGSSEPLSPTAAIANIQVEQRGTQEGLLEGIAIQDQVSANQKLWRAVIDNAIAEWVRGSAQNKYQAEQFLFYDEDDFPFVCRSAGMNPEAVRESLWSIRAHSAVGSTMNLA